MVGSDPGPYQLSDSSLELCGGLRLIQIARLSRGHDVLDGAVSAPSL